MEVMTDVMAFVALYVGAPLAVFVAVAIAGILWGSDDE